MTYAGTAGDTETEMANTLHFEMPKDQLHEGMRALHSFWTTPDKKKGIRSMPATQWNDAEDSALQGLPHLTQVLYLLSLFLLFLSIYLQ